MHALKALATRALQPRDCYINAFGQRRCYYSRWDNWGRWVLLGVILGVAVLIFFLFACLSARRRRRVGRRPFMGTGWAVPPNMKHNGQPQMEQGYQNAPPNYGNNQSYGQNANYYGGSTVNQYAPPAGAPPGQGYYGGDNAQYAPPSGPPPVHVR